MFRKTWLKVCTGSTRQAGGTGGQLTLRCSSLCLTFTKSCVHVWRRTWLVSGFTAKHSHAFTRCLKHYRRFCLSVQVCWRFLIFLRRLQCTVYSSDLQFLFLSRLKTLKIDFLNIYSPCNSTGLMFLYFLCLFFLCLYNVQAVASIVCTCRNGVRIPCSGGSHVSCRLAHFDSFGSLGVGGWCQAFWVKL